MKMIYNVEDKPAWSKLLVYAFQQVLAIMAATIAVPAIIGLPTQMPAAILGAGIGGLAGNASDTDRAIDTVNGVAVVADKLFEGETAIVALVQEDEPAFDAVFSGYKTTIIRYDAADIAADVEELRKIEEKVSEDVAAQLKAERKAERKAKFEAQVDEYVAATNRTMGEVTPM